MTRLDGEIEKYSLEDDLRSARRLIDPRLPTTREVKVHELKCHVPHRNWCWVCVRAEGKDLDHRADPSKDRNVPAPSTSRSQGVNSVTRRRCWWARKG